MPFDKLRHSIPIKFSPMTNKEFIKIFKWFSWGEKKKMLEEIKREPETERKINKLRFEQELLESRLTDMTEEESYKKLFT